MSLIEEASRFRAELLGDRRSTSLTNLFDYLLERSGDARPPKEIEVAIAVFGKSGTFDTSENSMVRGHVHRLRQRLDKFNAGKSGARLTIPKGEYRLILSEVSEQEVEEEDQPATHASTLGSMWTKRTVAVVLAGNALLWALVFLFSDVWHSPSPLARTVLWKPVITSGRPPVIAVGDFFLIGKSAANGMMERLALNPKIQSSADLTSYLMVHPEQTGKLHDRDIYRVPAGEAKAAMTILNLVSTMRPGADGAEIIPVSRISQDRADSSNIIYIQYFSQLGMLRSPILHLSGFAPTEDFNAIRDIASGEIYRARYANAEGTSKDGDTAASHSYSDDYGYLVSFPGASGKHDILIAGIGDTGLSQMVKLVADTRQLDALARSAGKTSAFEALYRVRSIGGLVFETKLLVARPLKADAARREASAPRARD